MPSENKTLTRAELYEKVWTTPMPILAKEFKLSDVGILSILWDVFCCALSVHRHAPFFVVAFGALAVLSAAVVFRARDAASSVTIESRRGADAPTDSRL